MHMSAFDKVLKKIKWHRFYQDNGDIFGYITELKKSFKKQMENFQPSQNLLSLIQSTLRDIPESKNISYLLYRKAEKEADCGEDRQPSEVIATLTESLLHGG